MLGKTLILGHGRHGKDTVAEMIAHLTGMTFQSSSRAALDAIWPTLKVCTGCTGKEQAFKERHKNRDLWKELITLYNTPDKSALCRKILSESSMYVGMRCSQEFAASKHLFDTIIWVDARHRKSLEPTMGISYESGMHWLNNNGAVEDLLFGVKRMVRKLT